MLKEASTITELHNASEDSEIKLTPLISEQIPRYKLRLDSVFGYDNSDCLKSPILPAKPDPNLTAEQCEETFKYLILGGIRLSQMTRTYHDIEAVTHLLEEKERDLELAARIGQTLLKKNRDISQYNEKLEEQLANALEEAYQLRHEINLKEDVLLMQSDDETDSSGAPSPVKELRHFGRAAMYSHVQSLQAQIFKLKEENADYQKELHHMLTQSEDLESIEQKLVSEAVQELQQLKQELKNAQKTIDTMTNDLACKTEENARQQEEITRLLAQIVDLHKKQKHLAIENEELNQHVVAANNAQLELTKEVKHLEDQYQEVSSMLEETREEVQNLRDYPDSYIEKSVPFVDSLAAEIKSSEEVISREMDSFSTPLRKNGSHPREENRRFVAAVSLEDLTQKTHSQVGSVKSRLSSSVKAQIQSTTKHGSSGSLLDAPFSTAFPLHSSFISSTPCSNRRLLGCTNNPDTSKPNSSHHSSLRLQLANKALAEKAAIFNPVPGECESLSLSSVCKDLSDTREFRSYHDADIPSPIQAARNKQTFHSWHGDIQNDFTSVHSQKRLLSPNLGRPGIPGTEDLDKAIQKLAIRRETMRYLKMQESVSEMEPHFSKISHGSHSAFNSFHGSPNPLSSVFIHSQKFQHDSSAFSPKLCIVKPLEGSVTLNQWKYLAKQDSDQSMSVLYSRKPEPVGIIRREHVPEIMSRLENSSDIHKSFTSSSSDPFIFNNVTSNISIPHKPDDCCENNDTRVKDAAESFSCNLLVASTEGVLKTSILKKEVLTSTRCTITDCFISKLDDSTQNTSNFEASYQKHEKEASSQATDIATSKNSSSSQLACNCPRSPNSMSKFLSELQKISGRSCQSDVVWNEHLKRAFSISSASPVLSHSLSSNRNQNNQTTPPNSPRSPSPASDFLLNEMMEKSLVHEKVNAGFEKSGFSTNLLAKLSKIGITVFPGLGLSRSHDDISQHILHPSCENPPNKSRCT